MNKKEKIILTIISILLISIVLFIDQKYAKFEKNKITINVEETQTLNVKTNIKNYYCTSTNEDIVRILNTCDAYGVSNGNAKIILKAGNKTDEINITVNEKEYFTFNEQTHNMTIGENYKLNYSTNIKNIDFNISNDNIIIKDNTVYALKKGTTIVSYKNNQIKIIVDGKTITATFEKGNTKGISKNKATCTITELNGSCKIILPFININDKNQIIGFENNNIFYKENQTVNITKDETFTAYIKNKITINYISNGADIEKTTDSCYEESCTFTIPKISREGYQILGYSTSKDATFGNYQIGNKITTNKNITLYAITAKKISALFLNNDIIKLNKPNKNYETVNGGIKISCTLYNQDKSCQIKTPTSANISENYELTGFKADKIYKLGETINLTENKIYESLYKENKKVPSDITIYISSNGNDNNTGLTISSPIKTINKAQEILKKSSNTKNVYIKIKPGTYENEHIVWTYYNGYKIQFMSTSNNQKPVYKGNKSTLPWFNLSLTNTNQVDIKISFQNIEISNYFTAININGGVGKIKNITINNMIFDNIGNRTTTTMYTLEECIKIKNATNISITNNKFTNILNNAKTKKFISAIKLNNTSNTLINNNTFINISGNPIILENSSNNNIIANNTFTLSGQYAYILENYKTNICQNNKVINNTFLSSHSGVKILTIAILENNTLYYNEEIENKQFYDSLKLKLIKKNISNRIKLN